MNKLKQGWEIKSLGELADIKGGKRVPKGYRFETEPTNYPYIRVTDFNDNGSVDLNDIHYINGEVYKQIKNYTISTNDLYISIAGTIGKTGIIPVVLDGANLTENACKLVFRIDVEPKFIYYFTKTDEFIKQAGLNTRVAAMPKLALSRLSTINLLFPNSLPEQQRIVAILDTAFAAIAKAKENAQRNFRNAKELFESYLQSVFANKGEGWEEKKLGEVANVIGGYSFKSTEFKTFGKYQVLRMGNVRPGIIRENENPVYMDNLDETVLKRSLLCQNDVIITQTGTKKKRDYGFTVIIEKDNYLLNQRISAIRFSKLYLPKFFLFFSWTDLFKDQYFANETGTVGQGNVGIGAITNAIIPFIPVNRQQTIVQKLDALSAETKKLEGIYQKQIEDLEELKKSILQKAFEGEL